MAQFTEGNETRDREQEERDNCMLEKDVKQTSGVFLGCVNTPQLSSSHFQMHRIQTYHLKTHMQ